jgi:hypothetical protein
MAVMPILRSISVLTSSHSYITCNLFDIDFNLLVLFQSPPHCSVQDGLLLILPAGKQDILSCTCSFLYNIFPLDNQMLMTDMWLYHRLHVRCCYLVRI